MEKIEEAGIWIPEYEVEKHYRKIKNIIKAESEEKSMYLCAQESSLNLWQIPFLYAGLRITPASISVSRSVLRHIQMKKTPWYARLRWYLQIQQTGMMGGKASVSKDSWIFL